MSGKKGLLIGCGAALGLLLLLGLGVGGCFYYVMQDPKGMTVEVEGPELVKQGEVFELIVKVTNERVKRKMKVSSIDLHDEYLSGFVFISADPASKSNQHIPIDNSRSFNFGCTVDPGATREFKFKLRATTPGLFRGDVDVGEGARFTTTMAQTEVK